MPPLPSLSPGYQFCTVEYLIWAPSERDQLDHRGVQLVLVAHRGGAALEVAHVGALLGDDQRALELAGVRGVDAEVGGQLHRAAHALGDVAERAVGEDRRVERGEEVVACRAPPSRGTCCTSSGCSRTASENEQKMMPSSASFALNVVATETLVEDRVHRHAGQPLLLVRARCRASRTSRAAPGRPRPGSSSSVFGLGAE